MKRVRRLILHCPFGHPHGKLAPAGDGAMAVRKETLAAATGIGLLLAMLGPFGTFGLAPLWERLIYWVGLMLISFMLYWPAYDQALRLARRRQLPVAAVVALAIALVSLPMTVIVWLASFRHTPGLWPSARDFAGLYGSVLVVAAPLVFAFRIVERLAAKAAAPSTPAEPAFLDRLQPGIRGELIALEMEDHYLRVHTVRGSDLILMRMRDAVAETEGAEGAQVHRSWWVARSAVTGVLRSGRTLRLRLSNGMVVPVARQRMAAAREARLIAAR